MGWFLMSTDDPLHIHVGSERPEIWDDRERVQSEANPGEVSEWLLKQRRPPFAANDIDWDSHGLSPRWVGDDAATCAAAVDPSPFHNQGADEYSRFIAGAQRRGDRAIVVARMALKESATRSIFGNYDSVPLVGHDGSVTGKQLGSGGKVRPSEGLTGADRDLAVRFAGSYRDGRLWALELTGTTRSGGHGTEHLHPDGELLPLVVDDLDDPVLAVWIGAEGEQRVYVVPESAPTKLILEWLATQAIPEFAPTAYRESRPTRAYRDMFPTAAERHAAQALKTFDDRTSREREALMQSLQTAHAAADDRRHLLLFGTGPDLEDAVAQCLRDASIDVVKVDELLGRTANADLLATIEGRRILIEVKSGRGNAGEQYYTDLETHLREWSATGQPPVHGGALIINHQLRIEPASRHQHPYSRPEFLLAQTHAIITTVKLLDLWREGAWADLANEIAANSSRRGDGPGPTGSRGLEPGSAAFDASSASAVSESDKPVESQQPSRARRRPWQRRP